MIAGSGTAAAVRAVFTAVVMLLAALILFYCVLIGVWVYSTAGSPGVDTGDVVGPAAALIAIALLAIGAVLVQLRWANRATDAGAIALRSLLALAGPGAVVLFAALAATW